MCSELDPFAVMTVTGQLGETWMGSQDQIIMCPQAYHPECAQACQMVVTHHC